QGNHYVSVPGSGIRVIFDERIGDAMEGERDRLGVLEKLPDAFAALAAQFLAGVPHPVLGEQFGDAIVVMGGAIPASVHAVAITRLKLAYLIDILNCPQPLFQGAPRFCDPFGDLLGGLSRRLFDDLGWFARLLFHNFEDSYQKPRLSSGYPAPRASN